MNDRIIPWGDIGTPMYATEGFTQIEALSGKGPGAPVSEPVDDAFAATAVQPMFTVVGRDATSGKLVRAVKGVTPAIGITSAPVALGATGVSVGVFRDGTWNPAALTWDASYATDEDKRLAFEETKNLLFILKPLYG